MAGNRLVVQILLILSTIGGLAKAADSAEFEHTSSDGCALSTRLPRDGSPRTFEAEPSDNCQTSTWQIKGATNAAFVIVFTDFSLARGEILNIAVDRGTTQQCDSSSPCPPVLVYSTPYNRNSEPEVTLTLQNQRQSISTERFSAVVSAFKNSPSPSIANALNPVNSLNPPITVNPFNPETTIDPMTSVNSVNAINVESYDDRRSDCNQGLPAWAIVVIVFTVFFFLTIMCTVLVRCCQQRRQFSRQGQVISTNPLANGAVSFHNPNAIIVTPTPPPPAPPAYPQDDVPDNFINSKFEMYNNNNNATRH